MIDPSYEEWQAALDALADSMEVVHPGCLVPHVVAILGPCPPKPVPICGRQIGSLRWACRRPENHPDACRPHLMAGDPPTEHTRRYGRG